MNSSFIKNLLYAQELTGLSSSVNQPETEEERASKQSKRYDLATSKELKNQIELLEQFKKLIELIRSWFSKKNYNKVQSITSFSNTYRDRNSSSQKPQKNFDQLSEDFLKVYNLLPAGDSIRLLLDSQKFTIGSVKGSFSEILIKIQNKEIPINKLSEDQTNNFISQLEDYQKVVEKRIKEIDESNLLRVQNDEFKNEIFANFVKERIDKSRFEEMQQSLLEARDVGRLSTQQERKISQLEEQIKQLQFDEQKANSYKEQALHTVRILGISLESLKNEKKKIGEEVLKTESDASAREQDVDRLNKQIARKDKQFKDLQEAIKESTTRETNERQKLEREIENLNEEIGDLIKTNEGQNEEIADNLSKIQNLIDRNKNLTESMSTLDKIYKDFASSVDEKNRESSELIENLKSKDIQTKEELSETKRQIAALEVDMSLVMEQYEDLHNQNKTAEQSITEAQNLVMRLQEDKKQIENKLDTQGKNNRKSDDKQIDLEKQITILQQKIKELITQNELEKKSGKQNSEQHKQEVAQRNQELETMKSQINSLRDNIEELNGFLEKETNEKNELHTRLEELLGRFDENKSKIEQMLQEDKEFELLLSNKQIDWDNQMKATKDSNSEEIVSLVVENMSLKVSMENLEDTNRKLEELKAAGELALKDRMSGFERLNETSEEARKQYDKLVSELKKKYDELEKYSDKLSKENSNSEYKIEELKEKINELNGDNSGLKMQIKLLKEELNKANAREIDESKFKELEDKIRVLDEKLISAEKQIKKMKQTPVPIWERHLESPKGEEGKEAQKRLNAKKEQKNPENVSQTKSNGIKGTNPKSNQSSPDSTLVPSRNIETSLRNSILEARSNSKEI